MDKRNIVCISMVVLCLVMSAGCTQNQRAKQFGGTANIELKENQKLVNVTWRGHELWILTKTMKTNDVAETYTFKEHSSFGVIEGTVIISERR